MSQQTVGQTAGSAGAQLEAIHRVCAALYAKTDIGVLLRETLAAALDITQAEAGSILLYHPRRRVLVFEHVIGPAEESLRGTALDPHGTGKCAAVFRTGVTDISQEGFDRRFDRRTHFTTQSTLTVAIRSFGGEPIGVIQVLNRRTGLFDVTDQHLLEMVSTLAATVIQNARMAQLNQRAALARVLAYFGHDIKNQAMIVQGRDSIFGPLIADALETLRPLDSATVAQLESDLQEMRVWIDEANEKALALARAMGEYGRRDDPLASRHASLRNCILAELGQLANMAPRYKVHVDLSGVRSVPLFRFDPLFVGSAVYNLTNNALKAILSSKQGDRVWVRTRCRKEGAFPDGGYVEVEVQDNGPGLPPDQLAAILRAEAQSKQAGGQGVGTRIAIHVAAAHNGRLTAESALGEGTTFRLRLPVRTGGR